jgi:hypothetical protein
MLYGILVTYRRPREFEVMLARLGRQHRPVDLLVVVDNAPGPDQAAAVDQHRAAGHATEYLAAPDNLGPAGGIALGMERVLQLAGEGDWLVVLDDDDPPPSDDLLAMLLTMAERMAAADPPTAAVGLSGATFDRRRGRLIPIGPAGRERHGGSGPSNAAVPVDCIGGNRFPLYRAEAVRAVGPFQSRLFFGWEELEFGLRLRDAGYTMYARLPAEEELPPHYHLPRGGRPTVRVAEPTWRQYYGLRNLIWVLRASGNGAAALRVIALSGLAKPLANLAIRPRAALAALRLNVRACRDGWSGALGRTFEPN